MRNWILAFLVATIFIPLASAEAAIIRWQIKGTATDPTGAFGTTEVSGTFVWDGKIGAFRDINVVSVGALFDGVTYGETTEFANQTFADFVPAGLTSLNGAPNLSIAGPDFGDRTMLSIIMDETFGNLQTCNDTANCANGINPSAPIIGSIHGTVIPLPAAGWLLLSGLGALGAVARKRRA